MSVYASRSGIDGDAPCGPPWRYLGSHHLPAEADPRGGEIGLAGIPSHITRDGRDDQPDDGAPWPWLRVHIADCGGDPCVILNRAQARHLAVQLTDWADSTGDPMSRPDQPTADLIRAAIADAVAICNGPLIDHAATGVLYALGLIATPPADGAPGPVCGTECAEGHTYTGQCEQAEPDYPAAYALARHIADHPMSAIQAAFRYLNSPITFELHELPDSARTAPDNPAASDVRPAICELPRETIEEDDGCDRRRLASSDDELREQYAAAMRKHYLVTNREEADADGNSPCRCGDWREGGDADEYDWDHHLAEAVLAVRDHRMEQLAADLNRLEEETVGELNETNTALARRAEQAERALRAARFTEQHWREYFLVCNPAAAHALAMTRSALDGQADPSELGLPEETHAAFLAALDGPAPDGTPDTPKER